MHYINYIITQTYKTNYRVEVTYYQSVYNPQRIGRYAFDRSNDVH